MTVTQMSITETTDSPQHKLHWLAEQALSWSGLPIVTVRPTVFLEGFFLLLDRCKCARRRRAGAADGRRQDLARLIGRRSARRRGDPRRPGAAHRSHLQSDRAPESADLDHCARLFSEALGRTIRYRDTPTSEWSEKPRAAALPEHVARHLAVMTELHKQGRYDRMSEDYLKLTGETPTSMADCVKLHAAEFTRP